jgi:glycosyltransferase involved in cell wall biosynthesis
LKICFATYAGVTITAGGPLVKINDLKVHLEKKGIEVDLFNMWEANQKIKDYDLFHIFGGNFAVYDLCRHLKVNNISYVVNPIIFSRHSFSKIKMMLFADKWLKTIINGIRMDYGYTRDICGWSSFVLPNTSGEAELIQKGLLIDQEKVKVIYNGVSERFLDGDPQLFKEKYSIKNFILYVGHLGSARKNGLLLIKALNQIDYPAVIIGRISSTSEGEKIKDELKNSRNIKFIDSLPNDSELLKSAYAACDTFVLPSWYETPGRAALEAGLAGAKIVITPNGGTKDYFNDMVEYINPYSVESIKLGIQKALNKPKDDKLKKYISKNFLWNKIADDTINLYNKVLSR